MIEDAEMLRDLFACFAMAGIVTRGEENNQYQIARHAYKIADAMLMQREADEQL